MPYLIPEKWKKEHKRARNAKGHFVSKDADPRTLSDTTLETKGPINIITKGPGDSLDEPLISFSIRNPFKRLLRWFDDIRKKQTTTFDFKIKIPLLALPIFLAVIGSSFQLFFNLGKASEKEAVAALPTPTPIVIVQPTATPAPVLVSRLGTIKATYQVQTLLNPSPSITIAPTSTQSSSSATPTEISSTATPVPSRYVLVKGEDVTFLIVSSDINLSYYLNRRVLITGLYDKVKDTLQVSKSGDIEILQ